MALCSSSFDVCLPTKNPSRLTLLQDDSFSPEGMGSRRPASPAAPTHLHKKRLMFTTASTSSPLAPAAIPESKAATGMDPYAALDDLTINTKVGCFHDYYIGEMNGWIVEAKQNPFFCCIVEMGVGGKNNCSHCRSRQFYFRTLTNLYCAATYY